MTAKRKSQRPQVEDGRDKPDYAADLFRREDLSGRKNNGKKQEEKKDNDDGVSTVAEHLKGDLASRLRAMKAALEEQSGQKDAAKGAKGNTGKPTRAAGAKPVRRESEPDKETASFAELFDPTPEDDESFEKMLEDSKLDWTKFKD